MRGDLGRSAASGQPRARLPVVADDGAVEVREPVDLGGAEEPHGDAPPCSQYMNISGTDTVGKAVAHSSPSGNTCGRAPTVPAS